MSTNHTIEEMQHYASLQGGKCLSPEYWDEFRKLKWMCSEGHTWEAAYEVISRGAWCPQCLNIEKKEERKKEKREKSLEKIKEIAKGRGGECLSDIFIDNKTKLIWQCSKGHIWLAIPGSILNNQWCKKCSIERNADRCRNDIEKYQKLAEERGGKLLSDTYKNNNTKMLWECSEGHQWKATPFSVEKAKTWCRICSYKRVAVKNRNNIEIYRTIAIERGGKLLSEKYINSITHLLWECKEGHQWWASPFGVKNTKTWCPQCYKNNRNNKSIPTKYTLEYMQAFAAANGGKCLSENFNGKYKKLKFECANGHKWEQSIYRIIKGEWCRECIKQQCHNERLEMLKNKAKERGGECLSVVFIDNKTKLIWQCSKGHIWLAIPGSILNNQWCKKCSIERNADRCRNDIEKYQKLAEERGGKLLSEKYINNRTPLLWECKEGHQWETPPGQVDTSKSWCPHCFEIKRRKNGEKRKNNIEIYRKIAEEKGGKLLSENVINNRTKLLWECSKGHQWEAMAGSVKNQKQWCRKCSYKEISGKRKDSIEIYRKIAEERGGKLLSEEYINSRTPLLWECKEGHQWKATPNSVKIAQTWCRICGYKKTADTHRDSIETYKKIAEERGGKLLSEKYINSIIPLLWECKEGHQWKATPSSIKNTKSWCKICGYKKTSDAHRDSIETFKKIAIDRGGKLLSDTYKNNSTKMLWECSEGHQWETTASTIKHKKSWCPHCKKNKLKKK